MMATERGRTSASSDANPAFAGAASAVMDFSPRLVLARRSLSERGMHSKGGAAFSPPRAAAEAMAQCLCFLLVEVVEILVLVEVVRVGGAATHMHARARAAAAAA